MNSPPAATVWLLGSDRFFLRDADRIETREAKRSHEKSIWGNGL